MVWRARFGMLCLFALGVQSCASGDEREHFGRVRFETEHFRYYALDGTSPCENTGYWLERFYSSISDYLEVPKSRPSKIDYEWVDIDRSDLVQEACRSAAAGCAEGEKRIVSVDAFDPHELTHIIAAHYGQSVSFFAEGLAEMLYCGHSQISRPLDKTLLEPSMLTQQFAYLGGKSRLPRALARSLVFYLTHHFEKRNFLRFYASIGPDSDLATIGDRFFDAFQVPFSDVITAWQAVSRPQDEECQYLVECEGEPVPDAVTFQTACGMESSPDDSDTFVSFDVGASGRVVIDSDSHGATPGIINVYSCDGGAAGLAELDMAAQTRYLITRPGRHFVWIRAEHGTATGTLTFRQPPAATDSCPQTGTPLTLPTHRWLVVTRRWHPSACSGLPWCPGESINFVVTEDGRIGGVDYFSITSPESVYRCDMACPSDSAASCVSDALVPNTTGKRDFNVVNTAFSAGQVVHLAAGPINNADDAFGIEYFLVGK